ncbi:MAG: hypothetical protein RBR93_08705 [Aliarcobacter butzleri]|nr:hypothetical protein [Aliarcobacter butzleri]
MQKEIRLTIDNLFLRGGVILGTQDLVDIFQYAIDNNIVTVSKSKGKTKVGIKIEKKDEKQNEKK